MVEYWIDGKYDFERAADRDLTLTVEAKKFVRDPYEFRKRYGDYFICGFQRRYSFHSIVNCKYVFNFCMKDSSPLETYTISRIERKQLGAVNLLRPVPS